MRRVRRSGTKPEQVVRAALTSIGARYRLNVRALPGSPDIANKSRSKAIFVHGCFWHYHDRCARGRIPRRNREFWREKLIRNRERDEAKLQALRELGFDVLVVWECDLTEVLPERLEEFWFDRNRAS